MTGKGIVTTDNFQLTCFSNNSVLLLKARYELVTSSMMIEQLTTQQGADIQQLVLHKVSSRQQNEE